MASYFVDDAPHGVHAVHDRSMCPPSCFPGAGTSEYLGEFLEAAQAIAVARLRYVHVAGCSCCAPQRAPVHAHTAHALTSSRP